MKITKTIKNTMAKCVFLGMAALAVMGASTLSFSNQSYAAEVVTNNNQTLYQKIPKARAFEMINLAKANGTVKKEYDNTVMIESNGQIYEYSYYDAGGFYVDENTHYDGVKNEFKDMESALQFIKDMMMEDGDIDHCTWYSKPDGTNEYTYVAVKGHLPLVNLSVKVFEEEKCTSLKLECVKTEMHTGDNSTNIHADMIGGDPSDIVWSCADPAVTLSPAGADCNVTAPDHSGSVFVNATAPNGVRATIELKFLV